MPESIAHILEGLERIAAYQGPWTLLQAETPLLRQRIRELKERENRLDDLLVVALVGGSGVGKSTLLNALAGDELAKTSEFRPCTSVPTVYHPPGARLGFAGEWTAVSGSALEHLVIIDTPDSDTIVRDHRDIVEDVLKHCDLVIVCADGEKYLDEATWSLIAPVQNERTIVCVETKASRAPSIREHWLLRLGEHGLRPEAYFRVNSRKTMARKVEGRNPGDNEYDFEKLERFLRHELTREKIRRIKRSNAAGLLTKTIGTLGDRVSSKADSLHALRKQIDAADAEVTKTSFQVVRRRLFAESHLWTYALGREMGLRAKGLIGALFRVFEAARTLPARMASSPLWPLRSGAGNRAADLLRDGGLVGENVDLNSAELNGIFASKQSGLALEMAQGGFTASHIDGYDRFAEQLNGRIAEVLSGPARERVVTRARFLTSWPLALLSDAPPLAFMGYSGYHVVHAYFTGVLLSGAFFIHAGTVLAILLAIEIFLLSAAIRFMAWTARRASVRDLRISLVGNHLAFHHERESVQEAIAIVGELDGLVRIVGDAPGP